LHTLHRNRIFNCSSSSVVVAISDHTDHRNKKVDLSCPLGNTWKFSAGPDGNSDYSVTAQVVTRIKHGLDNNSRRVVYLYREQRKDSEDLILFAAAIFVPNQRCLVFSTRRWSTSVGSGSFNFQLQLRQQHWSLQRTRTTTGEFWRRSHFRGMRDHTYSNSNEAAANAHPVSRGRSGLLWREDTARSVLWCVGRAPTME